MCAVCLPDQHLHREDLDCTSLGYRQVISTGNHYPTIPRTMSGEPEERNGTRTLDISLQIKISIPTHKAGTPFPFLLSSATRNENMAMGEYIKQC